MINRISIGVRPSYDVIIQPGILRESGPRLASLFAPCRALLLCDSTVSALYLSPVQTSLESAGFTVIPYTFPPGEEQKTLRTLADILEFMAEQQFTRSDCVIALGGGVCGDMAGFAAGCYMRGIRYVQIPTTLLAAVDSSVGGKTAVDLAAGKNLAGLFVQPAAVLCDPDCLTSLPAEQLRSGMAEAIKSGILDSKELFRICCAENKDYAAIIAGCVRFKGRVVELDEKEQNLRRCLNLGHTAGHAIEKLSDYGLSHGYAVAAGLAIITRAALGQGLCPPDDAERILQALRSCGLPTTTVFSARDLARAALADKKRSGSSITLVFPTGIGSCRLQPVPVDELEALLASGMED